MTDINLICKAFTFKEENLVAIYLYGSRIYGTSDRDSDYDYIVVLKQFEETNCIDHAFSIDDNNRLFNCTPYSEAAFQNRLDEHKINCIEAFFCPQHKIIFESKKFSFKLNKSKLRESFSEKASKSWVKCKKKLEVEKDRNVYIAKKSLFHSFRIIDFGIQLANTGKIEDFSSMNWLWKEIKENSSESWIDYETKYKQLHNEKMSEFRKVAPK